MNKYETVFILTPVLSDDQMKETVEKFKDVLTSNGGNIENEENWGLRKLAYPIENKNTGFYTLIEFEGEPTIVDKLETAFRRDEKVIRFLTFRLDKYAAEYAIKRRAVRKAKQEERAAQEAAEKEAAAAEPAVVEEAPKAEDAAPAAEA
ncbi:MAG: 30S ribosomal protein S6 [Muribaculaceae bacterium]|jgi:small subunit ribosomal protein S6|nr:30S ribosomal protein S6 [Muribaculaceae bacterium]MBR6947899.1 30S ribosomal protein S6 [Muribaculaceae bacterium]